MNLKPTFIIVLIFTFLFIGIHFISTTAAPAKPNPPDEEAEQEEVSQAVLSAINKQRENILGLLVNEVRVTEVQVSNDRSWGVAYLEMVDPKTGEVLPTEPGLAISRRIGADWKVTLPGDIGWFLELNSVPDELISEESKLVYLEMNSLAADAAQATIGGYLLPWEAGKTVYLSQSTGHDQYIPSGSSHYAFDFYISKTMYRLHASRAGTVWRARWNVPNGDDSDMGNYLVLKDTSTNPTTYQLYLHLAQGSIPPELRLEGTYVSQGQFIGIADDTGKSTGHHLHYHVHTNPNSYWGTSIDITFDDVDINGGRPRRASDAPYCTRSGDVCNQFRTAYVSGNIAHGDIDPPAGDLFEPLTGTTVDQSKVLVDGWVSDNGSGLDRAQILAYFNDIWHEVGDDISTLTFSQNWNMCSDDVPNGPVSIALRAWDKAGNPSKGLLGLKHIIKDFDCGPTPPACLPNLDQVAIFSDTDFRGDCEILSLGDYPDPNSFALVGDDNIESAMIGSNVSAALYGNYDFTGRVTSLYADDSNLDDNPIGGNNISSIKVIDRNKVPDAPTMLIAPVEGQEFASGRSLSFSWRDPGGSTQFRVRLNGPGGELYSPWISNPYWNLQGIGLTEGNYTWRVRARNCPDTACLSSWSQSSSFTITTEPSPQPTVTAPFSDNFESGATNWTLNGLWNRLNDSDRSHDSNYSMYYGLNSERNYDTGEPNSGDLTLRPVKIPDSNYVLRFWYRYQTEGSGLNWDQRWVQISTDGESFDNVLQLNDDVADYWHQATLDLSGYAGETIHVRFHFASLDNLFNQDHEGWFIDDIEILQTVLPTCIDADNTPAGATLINFGETLNGKFCPTGDVDYYKFNGEAGDRIVLDIDTPSSDPVNDLDPIIFLIDGDRTSVLAMHDDEIYAQMLDPHLGYELIRSGTYFVRVRLWSHPTAGGEEFTYSITLNKDNQKPSADFLSPNDGIYLPDTNQLSLSVEAKDAKSGISHIEFLYHSGDWLNSDWQILDVDQEGSDGWSIPFDTTALSEQKDIAFFANVYDWGGNWKGIGAWDLGIDRTFPQTALKGLSDQQESTALLLEWTGTDNLSGIEQFEIQTQINNGPWSDIAPNLEGSVYRTWYVGQPDKEYDFRLRGIDYAGNEEPYPSSAETTTIIPSASELCSTPDKWDDGRDDNSPTNAVSIIPDSESSLHNFCNPLQVDRSNDEDWISFTVELGKTYIIQSTPLADMTTASLDLFAEDGTTLLAQDQPAKFGEKANITWKADHNGHVYVRSRHFDGAVLGNIVSYQLSVSEQMKMYLPIVNQ